MIEWWVLIDPATNQWIRVSEEEAKEYPVVEGRLTYALPASALKELYE